MITGTMLLAVVVTALASMIAGWIWYSPGFFGNAWARAAGIAIHDPAVVAAMKQGMKRSFLGGFLAACIRVMVLLIVLVLLSVTSLGQALAVGILLSIGYSVTGIVEGVLWEMRSGKLVIIHGMFTLMQTVISVLIVYLWVLA